MDFDIEKILVKASGENVESYMTTVISDADKAQITFAFDEMFSGLSLLHWTQNMLLVDAWKLSLEDIRDFVFSIDDQGFVVDYLRKEIFKYKTKKLKALEASVHSNEYFSCDNAKQHILEESAKEKIHNGMEIIKNIVYKTKKANVEKQKPQQNILLNQYVREIEHERVREKK